MKHRMQIMQERSEHDLIETPWSFCSKWLTALSEGDISVCN